MKKTLALFLICACAGGQTVGWSEPSPTGDIPGGNGYLSIHYDSVSQQTIFYVSAAGTTTIYSSDIYTFNSTTHAFTHVGGNGFGQGPGYDSSCPADTASWPGDTHPTVNMAVDTLRNLLWLSNGVCSNNMKDHLYKMSLNADPTANAWTKLTPSAFPANGTSSQSLVYDPEHDVLIQWGYDGGAGSSNHWCYNVGTANATQQTIGCAGSDTWTQITGTSAQPNSSGFSWPWLGWSTYLHKVIAIGTTTGVATQIWSYDPLTKTWAQLCTGCSIPANLASPQFSAAALDNARNRIFYQHMNGTTAPKTYVYNIALDTFTEIVVTGTGPEALSTASYALSWDAAKRKLIAWSMSFADIHLWEGFVSDPVSPALSGTLSISGSVSIQ